MIARKYHGALVVLCFLMTSEVRAVKDDNRIPMCPPPANITDGCTCESDPDFIVKCIGANLTSLPLDLPNSDILVIQDNHITVIRTVPYTALKKLHLQRNKLQFLGNGAFANLQHLEELSLAHNQLRSPDPLTFLGLHNLKTLILEDNPFLAITKDTFNGANLSKLEVLELAHCELYAVETHALTSLFSLQILNTSHNFLSHMPFIDCPQHSLHSFHTWDLSYNAITEVKVHCSHMTKLHRLDLAYNRITRLEEDSMVGVQASLKSFNIRGNNVSYIDENAFSKCKMLEELDITFNAMSAMSETTLNWNQMEKVLVHDNPWDCGCENKWLFDQARVIHWNLQETLRCASPDDVAGKSVYDIDPSYFNSCGGTDHKKDVRIAMGVILTVCIVVAFSLFIYHQITKKKARQAVARGSSLGGGTPSYQRMQTDTDLAFSIDDDREGDELPNGSLTLSQPAEQFRDAPPRNDSYKI